MGAIRRMRNPRDHYKPKESGRKSRDPEERWHREPKTRVRLLAGLVALAMISVVGAVVWAGKRNRGEAQADQARTREKQEMVGDFITSVQFRMSVEDTLRGFLEGETPPEQCEHVVGGGAVADKVADYYTRQGVEKPTGFGSIVKIEQGTAHGVPMYLAFTVDLGTSQSPIYNLIPARAEILIEWESSVGYGEMQWDEFIQRRPDLPTQMRVYLSRSTNYEGAFSDSSKYLSFTVGHNSRAVLQGYVKRDSPAGKQLAEAVQTRKHPVNVRLRFPRDSIEAVVVIDEFLHNHWIDRERLDRVLAGRR